jgi:hypothetical protein
MASNVKSLSFKNFKGFSEEVHIELRPITLLFGANSAGKSSVLHALQYVREILERNNANADRTLQGGEAVDLGGFLNLVHGHDSERRIEIEIGMALGDTPIPELVSDALDDWQNLDDEVMSFHNTLQDIRNKVECVSVRLIVSWNSLREEPVVVGYEIGTNGDWCVKFEATEDGRDTRMRINRDNPIFLVETPDYSGLLDELDGWVNPKDLAAAGEATGAEAAAPTMMEDLQKVMASVWPELFYAAKEAGLERPGDGLRAWLTGGFQGALPRLDQMLSIPAPGATGAENVYIAREFTVFLSWLTIGPAVLLRDQLRKLRYVGPLRRIPPRRFEAALTRNDAAWSDGMAAWETLSKAPQSLVDRCSAWMANSDKLGTGYAIDRRQVQEFDMSQPVPKPFGRILSRMTLVDTAGLPHQPQDVGVGISQVLPVVVAAQDGSASLVCIEQPELHIHPSVQVGLGDLFIDGALNQGLSFLIETHSEHLILRLLRRIRESAEATGGAIDQALSPALIGVYCLSKREGAVTIDEIPVTRDGDFAKPWPQGFFDERGAELF